MMDDLKKAYQKKYQETHAATIISCKKDIEYGKNAATEAAVKGLSQAFWYLEAASNPEVIHKAFIALGFKAIASTDSSNPKDVRVKMILSGWSE